MTSTSALSPIAVKFKDAIKISGVGRTSLYDAIRRGELKAIKRGRSTLIMTEELKRWLSSAPEIRPRGDG